MRFIAISQRVTVVPNYQERRDCLDQQWIKFLLACGIQPILVPNHSEVAKKLLESFPICGVILTGGNDLVEYGGDAPERDEVELMLLRYSLEFSLPLLGICRGMQLIQHYFGVKLQPVTGHVTKQQRISIGEQVVCEDSYHCFGAMSTVKELDVWARANDGVIKAIKHVDHQILGIMWHPERKKNFSENDIQLFSRFFRV